MSLNAGQEIYNRALVTGRAPDGTEVLQEVFADPDSVPDSGLVASPNPTFAANASGWTATAPAVITRDTTTFDTSPAGGRLDRPGGLIGGEVLTHALLGRFLPAVLYTITLRVASSAAPAQFHLRLGTVTDYEQISALTATPMTFATYTLAWMPETAVSLANLTFTGNGAFMSAWYVDSLTVSSTGPTLVSRRGFIRSMQLPINNLDSAGIAAKALGEIWLGNHTSTPQRGNVSVTGDSMVRETRTGQSVPPGVLLTRTGEVMSFPDRIDPDTGAVGRSGRIAAVSYTPATGTAVITIDNARDNLSALLSRMAVVVDNTRAV